MSWLAKPMTFQVVEGGEQLLFGFSADGPTCWASASRTNKRCYIMASSLPPSFVLVMFSRACYRRGTWPFACDWRASIVLGRAGDLSDRPTREERLDRLRGDRRALMADMTAALAHEINQPLTAAANYLSAARRLVGANPAALAALDKTEAQLVRAGRIVGRLRELMARGEPETVTQSLHEVIRGACELAAPALKQANVDLYLRLEAAQDSRSRGSRRNRAGPRQSYQQRHQGRRRISRPKGDDRDLARKRGHSDRHRLAPRNVRTD